jgi:hypothetical protein
MVKKNGFLSGCAAAHRMGNGTLYAGVSARLQARPVGLWVFGSRWSDLFWLLVSGVAHFARSV